MGAWGVGISESGQQVLENLGHMRGGKEQSIALQV